MVFKKLGIIDAILKSITEEKYEKPSKIQELSIPLILAGDDVIAESATGSGKTLAFGSGIIQHAERGKGIRALVLTPTRELAEQVKDMIKKLSKYKHLNIIAVYGGVSINPQIDVLRFADVVIGTPGRILDHLDRRTIKLDKVHILVLDEADRMLDMGFRDDVEQIIRECPTQRQTLLFSATISSDINHLIKKYMKDPVKVSVDIRVDPKKLRQIYYDVLDNMKFSLLVHLLKNETSDLAMIFCNTRRNVDFVANNLKSLGINALAIHGGFSQNKRSIVMKQFHSQKGLILVCTDVAARGLDIKNVSHIYNYDTPKASKEYIHRIGRTARAGKEGKIINLISSRDHDNYSRLLRENNLTIPKETLPTIERVIIKWKEQERFNRREFKRQDRNRDSFRRRFH